MSDVTGTAPPEAFAGGETGVFAPVFVFQGYRRRNIDEAIAQTVPWLITAYVSIGIGTGPCIGVQKGPL